MHEACARNKRNFKRKIRCRARYFGLRCLRPLRIRKIAPTRKETLIASTKKPLERLSARSPRSMMSRTIRYPHVPVQRPEGTRIRSPTTTNAHAPAVHCRSTGRSGSCTFDLPQLHVESVPVEQIVGIERDDLAVGRHEVDAGALDRGNAEIEAVEELNDHDAEDLVVTEIVGNLDLGQATEKIA